MVPAHVRPTLRRPLAAGLGALALLATLAPATTATAALPPPEYLAVTPVRLLDTRAPGGHRPIVGETVVLRPTAQVPADAVALALNVTGTDVTTAGYVTVWPCGQARPTTSTLNLVAGHTAANLTVVPYVAADGICLFTQNGAHLVVDLEGHVPPGSSYRAVAPRRLLDTRSPIDPLRGLRAAGSVLELPVPDASGAVALNVTATDPTGPGYVTVWPCGAPRPTASNLNYEPGAVVPNAVVTALSATGTVCLFTLQPAHLVVDLVGVLPTSLYRGIVPMRLFDTRLGSGLPVAAGTPMMTIVPNVAGFGAAVLNFTVTGAEAPGFLTVWPCDQPRPTASNLNYDAGDTVANAVVSAVGTEGLLCFFSSSAAHVIADLSGRFAMPTATGPIKRAAPIWPTVSDEDRTALGLGRLGASTLCRNGASYLDLGFEVTLPGITTAEIVPPAGWTVRESPVSPGFFSLSSPLTTETGFTADTTVVTIRGRAVVFRHMAGVLLPCDDPDWVILT